MVAPRVSRDFFDAVQDEPPVHRVAGDESDDHPDLHHEPERSGIGGKAGGGEQHELVDRHPAEYPDLEGAEREEVGLGRELKSFAQGLARRDDEVLEQDPPAEAPEAKVGNN
jgi:hypothetical protein